MTDEEKELEEQRQVLNAIFGAPVRPNLRPNLWPPILDDDVDWGMSVDYEGNVRYEKKIKKEHTEKAEKMQKENCFNHEWQKYEGFTEIYEFCVHCDVKRECK